MSLATGFFQRPLPRCARHARCPHPRSTGPDRRCGGAQPAGESGQARPFRRHQKCPLGYVTKIALNEDDEIIGYKFVNFGKMMDFIKAGDDANTAFEKAQGQYGRVADAVKFVDPRQE